MRQEPPPADLESTYIVPEDMSLFITAHPIRGEPIGQYGWEFSIEGDVLPGWKGWYYKKFNPGKYGEEMFYGSGICALLFLFLIFGGIGICIKKIIDKRKGKKDGDEDEEDEPSVDQNKPKGTGGESAGGDLELESLTENDASVDSNETSRD